MSKMIQIRNVSEDVHRKLKSRAALAGQSLSDYLRAECERLAEVPTLQEMAARLARRPRIVLPRSAAELVREERDSR